jgi:two-component system cell cycle sensor histidine kinase/response regulator CckA
MELTYEAPGPIAKEFAMDAQTTETRETATEQFLAADELAGAETILLVEDDAFVRDVTVEVLRSAGYEVLIAKNAAEAAGVYSARPGGVKLLLSDVVLPGENGRALARRLQRENPELKVLLITGYAEQMGLQGVQEQEQEEEQGEDEEQCLAKPFSTDILLRRVRRMLHRAELPIGTGDLLTPACGNA